jgi:hypothetical protein
MSSQKILLFNQVFSWHNTAMNCPCDELTSWWIDPTMNWPRDELTSRWIDHPYRPYRHPETRTNLVLWASSVFLNGELYPVSWDGIAHIECQNYLHALSIHNCSRKKRSWTKVSFHVKFMIKQNIRCSFNALNFYHT